MVILQCCMYLQHEPVTSPIFVSARPHSQVLNRKKMSENITFFACCTAIFFKVECPVNLIQVESCFVRLKFELVTLENLVALAAHQVNVSGNCSNF